MRQIVQNISNGKLEIVNVPVPMPQAGEVLIQNRVSLLSAGTEKTSRELAKKSLLGKARERPDQVRRVVEKIRQEGIWNTVRQVREKLDEPMPMGYCSAGTVIACGDGVQDFQPGDRVASNGPHGEVVCVPKHLCARIPDEVSFDQAAFTVLGAIALHGVRLAQLSLGETAVVIGLGLVGQLTTALLRAAGVAVIGTDLDPTKCGLATKMGIKHARVGLSAAEVLAMTGGRGADAVLITASTPSAGPVTLAGEAVRKKGRVVAVGAVGMDLPRRTYYYKEAEFVVSCSYGPGRYDPFYEDRGNDYPAAYVRWTEQRNLQAFLDLAESGSIDVTPLVTHRFPIEEAPQAYELIEAGHKPFLGVLLEFPNADCQQASGRIRLGTRRPKNGSVGVGMLGIGNFARLTLLPEMQRIATYRPEIVCSASGLSSGYHGEKFGFTSATNQEQHVCENEDVDAVFILTRHDQHARQVVESLRHGKHVFVEKPLCLTPDELAIIEQTLLDLGTSSGHLMVGYNRRFAPVVTAVRSFLETVKQPLTVSIRLNAGAIEPDNWIQVDKLGGGRIVGEACHAIDLATFLTGSPVLRVYSESIGGADAPPIRDDQCFITLRHLNGSVSSIAYLAGGDRTFHKERVEAIGGGRVAVIHDFCRADGWNSGKRKTLWRGRKDKGHHAELLAFASAIESGGPPPISWDRLRNTTLASFAAVQSIREGLPIYLDANCEVESLATQPDVGWKQAS